MVPPERLGRYEVVGVLGKGAMGTVYRADDPELGRPVAIKVLQAAQLDRDVFRRFRHQGQAAL